MNEIIKKALLLTGVVLFASFVTAVIADYCTMAHGSGYSSYHLGVVTGLIFKKYLLIIFFISAVCLLIKKTRNKKQNL